jgi:hypothetical protein
VYLALQSLQAFITLTNESRLVRLVEELTLVGIAGFRVDDAANSGDTEVQGTLLAEALNNIRVKSQTQNLRSLSLEVVARIGDKYVSTDEALRGSLRQPCKPRPARPVWETTAQTFQIAIIGLVKSQLPVLELDLFTTVQRCALGCDILPTALNHDLLPALQNVKKLSMSVSEQFPTPKRPVLISPAFMTNYTLPWDGLMAQTTVQKSRKAIFGRSGAREIDCDGWMIREWLGNFPAIESLELEWFDVLGHAIPPPAGSAETFFDQIGETVIWPRLTKITLRNISTSVTSLDWFFRNHRQLQEVVLYHVRLTPLGGITRMGNWLMDEDVPFKYLEISELCRHSGGESIISRYLLNRRRPTEHKGKWSLADLSPGDALRKEEDKRRLYGPPWRLD